MTYLLGIVLIGGLVCLVLRDITERKKIEGTVLQKTKQLAQAEAEREQLELFAYLASHDLQEPLQKIIGFGELLKAQKSKLLDDEANDYVARMIKAASRMSWLIDDLSNFSRILAKKNVWEKVDLNEALRQALSDLEVRIRAAGAKMEVEKLPVVVGDGTQIRSLFQNLVGNAIKFRKKEIAPQVIVKSRPVGHFVEIIVQDNGIGFDEKHAEKIFRPFERLQARSDYEGSGLGLAICRRIVQNHGGQILAKSRPGEGASFIVRLPAL